MPKRKKVKDHPEALAKTKEVSVKPDKQKTFAKDIIGKVERIMQTEAQGMISFCEHTRKDTE